MSTSINFQVEKHRHRWAKITFTLGDDQGRHTSKSVIVPSNEIAVTMDRIMESIDPSKDITVLATTIADGFSNHGVGRSGFTLRLSN